MKSKIALGLVAFVALLGAAAPAGASSQYDIDNTFKVTVVQRSIGGDTIRFEDRYSSLTSNSSASGFSSGFFSDGGSVNGSDLAHIDLYEKVERALGVDPTLVTYTQASLSSYRDDEITADTHQNVFLLKNGTYALNVDVSSLGRAINGQSTQGFSIGACPVQTNATNSSSRPADFTSDGCNWWIENTSQTTDRISYSENPSTAAYWRLIGWLVFSVAIATVVTGALTYLLRRSLKTLGTTNLVLACIGSFLGWLAVLIAFFVIFGGHSIDEFTLAKNLSSGAQSMWVAWPALLFMLPFMVPVALLVMLPPPEPRPIQTVDQNAWAPPTAPGVPTWLGGPAASPSTSAAPSQWQTPPPGWQTSAPPAQKGQWRPDNAPQQPAPNWQQSPPAQQPPAPNWQQTPPAAQSPAQQSPAQQPPAPQPPAPQPPAPQPPAPQPESPSPETPTTNEPPAEPPQTWHPPA